MRKSVHQEKHGFSLVEVMAILVVIGLMSSVVILTFAPKKPEPQIQTESLNLRLNALARQAMISGTNMAAGFSKTGFTFYSFERGQWVVKSQNHWTGKFDISVQSDGQPIELPKTTEPMIFFEASGLSTSFFLLVENDSQSWKIINTGNGSTRIEQVGS